MPTFAFQARTKTGERVAGTREAADQRAALEALRESELFVTDLQAAPNAKTTAAPTAAPAAVAAASAVASNVAAQNRPRPPQIAPQSTVDSAPASTNAAPLSTQPLLAANNKSVSLFFRQLYAMLHAGSGVAGALNTMAQHAPSPALRSAARQMAEKAAAGRPMSEQMRAFPGLFSELQIGLIAAGENGGFLDRMCLRLAEYSERDYELEQTVKRETWYPKLLVVCAILIPAMVPAVLASHGGGSGIGAFIGEVAPKFAIMAALFALWFVGKRVLAVGAHGGVLRETLDGAKFVLPIVAKVTRALASAKFCRAMGALYSAGMGPGKMVDIASGACGNAAFAARVRKIIPNLQNGAELTASLASTGQFPPVALQMLHTGEVSGKIDEQMDKVADFLEADAETAIKQSVKVLGIVVFLAVAMYIGSLVIQQYSGTINGIMDDAEKLAE